MTCKWLWRIIRSTYPWLPLALTLYQIATSTESHRYRAQVRFWRLYSRIDFATLLAIAIDLIQPEYWV